MTDKKNNWQKLTGDEYHKTIEKRSQQQSYKNDQQKLIGNDGERKLVMIVEGVVSFFLANENWLEF